MQTRAWVLLAHLTAVGCSTDKQGGGADLGGETVDMAVTANPDLVGNTADLTAVGVDLAGVVADLTGSGAPDLLAPDLLAPDLGGGSSAPSSDPFDGANLGAVWSIFKPSVVSVAVSGGRLHMTPGAGSLWYNDAQGPAVYQNVTGNFKVTSTVHAHRKNMGLDVPPVSSVHLAGLMARRAVAEGNGSQEDYVFIVVGFDVNDLSVEHKTTDDGVSTYDGPTWPNGEAELRICRIGATFRVYKRAIGGSVWTLAQTYTRADLPATLQVGAVTYSTEASPDVTGSFDAIDFGSVAVEADCTN